MKEEFLEKLSKRQYISNYLFKSVQEKTEDIIPSGFQLDAYNDAILEKLYLRYQNYFKDMYKGIDDTIQLDKEQIKAILADEDYSLILAGAGTGKTTTMASKVKYLVDIKQIDPLKIVVMSYTRKATEELEKRIVRDFEISAQVLTFHSLGMLYIKEIFQGRKCYVVDDNLRDKIFYEYFKDKIFPYPDKIQTIANVFSKVREQKNSMFGKHFLEHHTSFKDFESYFEYYKETKLKEVMNLKEEVNARIQNAINSEFPKTIRGEFVKSKGEALIANFLYCNGIDYSYEKIYKELMPDNSTYRPDFTLELAGEEIYIEYFGLTDNSDEENKYNQIRKQKEDYHRLHHNKLITLDYMNEEKLLSTLKEALLQLGFQLKPISYKDIFYELLNQNPVAQVFPYKQFLYKMIDLIKSSPERKNYKKTVEKYIESLDRKEKQEALIQFYYVNDFYLYYQEKLYGAEEYGFDFSDMIYYANLYIKTIGNNNKLHFEYLIIDEYQDISKQRYEFMKNIAEQNHAKIVAVGDDWQSIFAFAGSKVQYIYRFEQYFKGAKLFKISQAYRNSQDLIRCSSKFIMRNESQIKKSLVTHKDLKDSIRFVFFEEDEEYAILKRLILQIHHKNPTHHILVLARNNRSIAKCYKDVDFKDDIGTKIKCIWDDSIIMDGMTIHKSKGLTSDEVIVIGLSQNFPSSHQNLFWLETLFRSHPDEEDIPFAEERRLFYVALTRTKNYVYLLVNKNPKLRSPFVNELYQLVREEKMEMI